MDNLPNETNEILKAIAKIILNSEWGKHAEKQHPKHIYCSEFEVANILKEVLAGNYVVVDLMN